MTDFRTPPPEPGQGRWPGDHLGRSPEHSPRPRQGGRPARDAYQPRDTYPARGHYQPRDHYPAQDIGDTRMIPPATPRGQRSDAWRHVGDPQWDEQPSGYRPAPPGYVPGYDASPPDGLPPRYGGRPPTPPRGPRHRSGPSGPDGPRPPRRASGRVILGRLLAGLLSLALLLVSGLAWAAVGGTPHNASDATDQAGSVGVITAPSVTTDAHGNLVTVAPATGHGMNILIVGSDARTDAEGNPLSPAELKAVSTQLDGGGVSTDTIMIVHVPGNGAKATAISIPRDSWIGDDIVNAPGVVGPYSDGTEGPYKANKVNSYYGTAMTYEREYLVSKGVSNEQELQQRSAEAGRTMLIKVLQQFTGIKIDHYAEVNLIGFYLLSNAIGGVPVCLVKPVKDRQSGADFPAGHFEVSGSQALSFVRQRHGLPGEDLARIRRQQAFLASAADKMLSLGTLTSPKKLTALIDAADRSLVLDKGFDLLSFAQQMINLASGNITFTTIPTHGSQMIDGKSALKVDPTEVRSFFANLMTDKTTPASAAATAVNPARVVVDVQNGTETAGMAAQAGAIVAAAGFQRGQLSDYPGVTADNQQAKTTIHYPAGGEAAAAKVAAALKVGAPVADDSVAAGHLLVVVGTDMPVLPADQIPSVSSSAPPTSSTPISGLSTTMPSDAINASNIPCIN